MTASEASTSRKRGSRARTLRLRELARVIGAEAPVDAEVNAIAVDSRDVHPGSLFVALQGQLCDGSAYAHEAVTRGAVAVVSDRPLADVPTLVANDPRSTVAPLAAALQGAPAERMLLVGVTGTLGKTSTSIFLRSIWRAGGADLGLIGSLGITYGDTELPTAMTTPDAPVLQKALRDMADADVSSAAMEVTSHALAQHRLDGVCFDLGLLTNLAPDEHLEFHATPEDYLRVKMRFFQHMRPGAPVVANGDDPLVRERAGPLHDNFVWVSHEGRSDAAVLVSDVACDADGSRFTLHVTRPLLRIDGVEIPPMSIACQLPSIGQQQVANFCLAASASLLGGADRNAIVSGAYGAPAIRRRMEIVRRRDPAVIDDTVGHPRSVRLAFATAARFSPRRSLRVLFGVRGHRGETINRALGETLGEVARQMPCLLFITSSEDCAGSRDRVSAAEREAFLEGLRREMGAGAFSFSPNLADAARLACEGAGAGDVIFILGAQGMDEAARLVETNLARGQ